MALQQLNWIADRLHGDDVLANYRATLQSRSRIHIPGFLEQSAAERLREEMDSLDWRMALQGFKELQGARLAGMSLGQQQEILRAAYAGTGGSVFDFHAVAAEFEAGRVTSGALAEFYLAINSAEMLAFFRKLTGEHRIAYLDAQATRYRTGHFLTQHDDAADGRLLAYVFNLSPDWRTDWGGLLMFVDAEGHVAEAFAPVGNGLNIFTVPQPHLVSMVTPFARNFRYSITGWMRSKRPS